MAGENDGIERGDRISRSRRGRKPEPVEADVVANADLGAVPYYKLFSSADLTDYLLMFVGTMGAIGNGTCLPLMTVLLGEVVNALGDDIHMKNMYRSQVVHQVSKVSLKFVYLAMGTMVGAFLQVSCWIITGERQATRVRCLYLKAILRQEIGFFDKETTSTGKTTVGRMSGDSVLIQDAMGEKVGKFLQLIATFIAGFAVALVKGWKLAMVMALFIPLVFLSSAVTSLVIKTMASRVQAAQTVAATVVEQTVASMRTVASFTGEKQATAQYNESLATAYKCSVQEGLAAGFASGVVKFFILCSYALGLWFGARMITNDGYKGGDVLVVIFALLNGSLSLGHASSCLSAFGAGQVAAFKMFEVIDRKPEIDADNMDGRILDHFRGDIKLTDVYFCYPSRPEEPILSGFSLSMPSGSSTALVGVSGSGKSTVISLMERFFDPQAGEVLVDGINLKELQLKWVRQRIALVSQEPVLFPCSIKDNVGYGKDGATTEEIRAAVELANAAEFIDKMPQGLDTMVGEHGSQLSGGQKQRLAIARAIIRDPRVLLLDEATSALDPESERTVQGTLDRIMINRTTLVVAHRLSTVKNAHMIAVIHGGKIVEKGSHTELTKDPDGAYSQLIRLQEIGRLAENSVLHDPNKNSQDINSTQHFPFLSSRSADVSLGVYNAQLHHPSATSSQQPPEVSLYRLAHLNKPEIPVLLLGTLAAIANGVIFPVFGVLISSMIRTFYEASDELQKDSRFWAVMFVSLGFVCLLVHPLKSYFFVVAGCKLIRRIRSKCFERVVHMEISWFDEPGHSSGAIGARLSADAALVSRVVGDALGMLVQNTASAVAGLAIAFEANWELAFIVLVLLPLLLVNGYVQLKFIEGFTGDATRTYEGASEVANDAVRGIRTVASLCAEEKVIQVYQKRCGDTLVSGIREGLISGMGYGFSLFLLFCFYAATFYAGALLIEAGNTTFAQVLRVHFALSMAAIGVTQSGSLIPDASKAKSAAASIFGILDLKTQIDSSDDSKGMIIDSFKGEIEFEHVSFKYPARPQVQILRDVCLVIPHGKIVALIGESGCGKSTVVSLLQRFYEPDAGRIKLDGIEIKKLRVEWLRQQMGVVNQEPVLFNDTIRANIAYGYGGGSSRFYTEAEIVAASEKANAHSFITGLGQGYDTIVGEGGIQLSGGQKQRVAIARAIVKVPRILLLDEPTSALDGLSESLVQKALLDGNGTTTTLVVAHRLSTIQNADFIAVLRNGVVAEQGAHHTLITIHNGIYSSLLTLHSLSSNSNFL